MLALSWVAEEQKLVDQLVVMGTPFRRVVVVKDTDYDKTMIVKAVDVLSF